MIVILSCVGFLTASLFIYLSFRVEDEVESEVAWMLGASIFLLSFVFGPLLIKLVMVIPVFMAWPYIVARLSLSFYRQLKKR